MAESRWVFTYVEQIQHEFGPVAAGPLQPITFEAS